MEKPEWPPADWRCTGYYHNSDTVPCENPECWKHDPPDPRWLEYEKWFHKLAEEIFKK